MPHFKDAKGDTWPVVVNGGTIKRALDLLKVDLGNPLSGKPPLLTRFDTDIAFKVDVIYVACLPEAEKRGVTDLEFAERLEADALYAASEGLLEALSDFFQKLRRTEVVTAIRRQRDVVARAVEILDQALSGEEFDGEMDKELTELGESCASLLQSRESDPSPTA